MTIIAGTREYLKDAYGNDNYMYYIYLHDSEYSGLFASFSLERKDENRGYSHTLLAFDVYPKWQRFTDYIKLIEGCIFHNEIFPPEQGLLDMMLHGRETFEQKINRCESYLLERAEQIIEIDNEYYRKKEADLGREVMSIKDNRKRTDDEVMTELKKVCYPEEIHELSNHRQLIMGIIFAVFFSIPPLLMFIFSDILMKYSDAILVLIILFIPIMIGAVLILGVQECIQSSRRMFP